MSSLEIRVEDDTHVFIAKFDRVYTNIVTDLFIIHKRSAQTIQALPQHYYQLGLLIGKRNADTTEGEVTDHTEDKWQLVKDFVTSDAVSISYQTLGQYRRAVLDLMGR